MATIVYGRSVKPVPKETAAVRRNARRADEAIKSREVEAILAAQFGQEAPQRRVELSRAELACKRQVTPSVNRAVDTETEYHKQILAGAAKYIGGEVQDGMCLPEIAIFAAGYRKSKDIVTAR